MLLEKYVENFDEAAFVKEYMKEKKIPRKSDAIKALRRMIREEGYYQTKIMNAIRKEYPRAAVWKNTQGSYSTAGTPDLSVIVGGVFFGFEVKRPVLGEVSKLQLEAIEKIRKAGGSAAVVRWPEEALAMIRERMAGE